MGLIAYFTGNKLVERGQILPKSPQRFLVLGALMGVYFVTMFEALKVASPVSTGAVFTLMPMISAGFGVLFLAQRVSPRMMISLLIAAAGAVWVIFRGDLNALLSFNIGTGEMIFFCWRSVPRGLCAVGAQTQSRRTGGDVFILDIACLRCGFDHLCGLGDCGNRLAELACCGLLGWLVPHHFHHRPHLFLAAICKLAVTRIQGDELWLSYTELHHHY